MNLTRNDMKWIAFTLLLVVVEFFFVGWEITAITWAFFFIFGGILFFTDRFGNEQLSKEMQILDDKIQAQRIKIENFKPF